jgi:hypothetical protein
MSTSIDDIKDKLITNVRHQRTPTTYTDDDYLTLAINGCKRFYNDTGLEDSWSTEYSDDDYTLTRTLNILQVQYCVVCSEIEFFMEILMNWNTLVSYTTNALSVAHSNKPFEHLEKIIDRKENKLVELFQKMTDVANMTSISDITVEQVDFDFDG